MPGNANYDTLLATTLVNHQSELIDVAFTARPFAYFLKEGGNVDQQDGGTKIVQPLLYGRNTTSGSYSGTDVIDTAYQGGLTAAEYEWKQWAVSITISGIEEAKNNSEFAIVKLLESKILQAKETVIEDWDEMFIAGDGTANGGKDWNGLANLVAQNTTSVGGIDPSGAGNTFWNSTVTGSSGALTIAKMNTTYNTISRGNDQPNLLLTTQTQYENYEALLQPNMRFQNNTLADGGFINLAFKGAGITYDTYVPSGYMYFLNTKYLNLVAHTDVWFDPTPFVRPPNQDAKVAQILSYGNLVVSNRQKQGLQTGATV